MRRDALGRQQVEDLGEVLGVGGPVGGELEVRLELLRPAQVHIEVPQASPE